MRVSFKLWILFFFAFSVSSSVLGATHQNNHHARASKGAKVCFKLACDKRLTKNELFKITFFIETKLAGYIAKKKYYLTQNETGLLYPIEYDPETHFTFIHLQALVGQGADKKVTKSILYDVKKPRLLARLVQKSSEQTNLEAHTLRRLKGSQGILQLVAQTSHRENGIAYTTFFTHYYWPGSLAAVLNDQTFQFSLNEKMNIALDILKALEMVEKMGIIHRDLKKENYLIEIVQAKKRGQKAKRLGAKRRIQVVIADFGNATQVTEMRGHKPQFTSSYNAPEGIFFNTLNGCEYYKTDLFAAGCVLYRLFYEKKPLWQKALERSRQATEASKKKLVDILKAEACKRRDELELKESKGSKLSAKEELELVILLMVHPEPSRRSCAKSLRKKLESILVH